MGVDCGVDGVAFVQDGLAGGPRKKDSEVKRAEGVGVGVVFKQGTEGPWGSVGGWEWG